MRRPSTEVSPGSPRRGPRPRSRRTPRWRLEGARASAGFAIRTTAAAQVALLSASALGLHHTHWAAMTVWLVAQPTRGLLLDKSLLRIAGTLVGAGVGSGLLALFPHRLVPLVAGVSVWGAVCAGASALFRPARAYGVLLAGCTAIILALPSTASNGPPESLVSDRILCTLLGVLVSTAITALFTPADSPATLDVRLRALADEAFSFAHAMRSSASPGGVAGRQRRLVAEIGRVADEADRALSGVVTNRRRRREVRYALRLLLGLVVEARVAAERPRSGERERKLADVAAPPPLPAGLEGDALVAHVSAGALGWGHDAGHDPATAPRVDPLAARHGPGARSVLDHREAAIAFLKAAGGMAFVAAIWWASGWAQGARMMVSASIFLTLFAANESARTWVTHVLAGSTCGAAGAILYVVLLPLAGGPAGAALLAAPFLFAGAWAMATPATAKSALDFNMVFLLAAPPAFTLRADVAETAGRGLAIVVGVLAASLFFHATHEPTARRVRRLSLDARRALGRIAGSRDAGTASLRRGVLADHVVRIAAAADQDARTVAAADAAIELLAVGGALARLVPLRDVDARSGADGPVARALDRVGAGADGVEAALELERAAATLERAALPGEEDGARVAAVLRLRDAARLVRRAWSSAEA